MKHLKKVIALVLTLVTAIAMATPAFAEDAAPKYDKPLTITGLAEGDVVHFYKVIEWVGSESADNVSGWKAVSPFNTILDKEKLTEVLVGTKGSAAVTDPETGEVTTPAVEAKDPTGITAELAGQLAAAASGTPTDITVGSGGKAVFQNPAEGTYIAIITPADTDTVYGPVFVSADYNKDKSGDVAVSTAATYSDTAAAKKSEVTLTKTATTSEDNWDDKKWETVAIGDTVSFKVATTIPGYGKAYTDPVFNVTDQLTDLTLVTDSVTVTKPTGLTKGTDYTVTATAAGYTVSFAKTYLQGLKVSTTAPKHVNTEKNTVSTEFSNNPNNSSEHGFKKDATNHYTFTINANGLGSTTQNEGKKTSEIVKVGLDAKGDPILETVKESEITSTNTWTSPLAGAKFKLYTDEACTQPYVPKKADGSAGTAAEYVTDADGRLAPIAGLDAGIYWLQESEAPTGFVKDTKAHKIEIIATVNSKNVTEYTTDGQTWISQGDYDKLDAEAKKAYKSYTYDVDILDKYEVKIDGEATATYNFVNNGTANAEIDWTVIPPVELPFDIVNTKGTELPSTGGMGTKILYTIGGLMVVAGGVFLAAKKRMSTIEE